MSQPLVPARIRCALKWAAGAAAVLAALAVAFVWWARGLERDNGAVRPRGSYALPGGAVLGGPAPAADGLVTGSEGARAHLPVLPEERPTAIHRAATVGAYAQVKTCFWPGPRARAGVYSTDLNDVHLENQFSDTGTTYGVTTFQLPAGASLVMKGRFPHMRHWNFVVYKTNGTPVDSLTDADIEPDPGSANPFRLGVRRDVARRDYTIRFVAGAPPAQRVPNTVYTHAAPGEGVPVYMRNYVPDAGADYLGNVGWPEVELHYQDGKVLRGQEACDAVAHARSGKQLALTLPSWLWLGLSHTLSDDPMAPGAVPFEVAGFDPFFNRAHTLAHMFVPRLAAAVDEPNTSGGWYVNPATRYGYKVLNYRHGKTFVVTGKLPVTPPTYRGDGAPRRPADMLYWSMCSNMAPPTGLSIDCVYDEQIEPLLGPGRRYAIVTTRAADRPSNAHERCGVAWLEFGNGDGVVGGSPDFSMLINRNTSPAPGFKATWAEVRRSGSAPAVMGDYMPTVVNLHDKANFEALGCPLDFGKLEALLAPRRGARP